MNRSTKLTTLLIVIAALLIMYQSKSHSSTFGKLYNLDDNAIFNSIDITRYSEFSLLNGDTSRDRQGIEVSNKSFRLFYDYLFGLKVKKVKSQKVVELENLAMYSIGVSTKTDDGYYQFSVDIGKYYLLVSTSDDNNIMMFKHEFTVEEYKDVIDKLEECSN